MTESTGGRRIALVCARFPPFVGGTEVHVSMVGAILAERGHDVTVLTTVLDEADVGESFVDGMRVSRVRARPSGSDLYFAPSIRRRILDGDFDVVHVQGYHTFVAPLAMIAARSAGVPYVVTFHSGGHSSKIRRALRPVQHLVLRPLLRRAAKLIAVSDFERDTFLARLGVGSENIVTIANGVDQVFSDVVPDTGSFVVSSVGRLEQYKGHHHVIEAFAAVAPRFETARLQIIGTGSFEPHLRMLVDRFGLSESVTFTSVPFEDRRAMAQTMADSHVVVLASSYESQGIVGFEAVATGASLIVFDGSALADLAGLDAVDVVACGSVEELTTALAERLSQPRSEERPRFPDWADVAERLESVYDDVLGSSSR